LPGPPEEAARRAGRAFDLETTATDVFCAQAELQAAQANQSQAFGRMITRGKHLTRGLRMASRQMKMPEKMPEKTESEPEEHLSQRKRPEFGRYLLQVDRQTKGSYQTVETAESAGLAIKKEYPILHVTIYDSVECTSTALAPPAA
jgi:hypothetical protein